RLAAMKRGAFLINTARGDVVDQNALIEALRRGEIAGAGLDVFDGEPQIPEPLKHMENVVLLPHLGSATKETRVAMGMQAVENLVAFFDGRPVPDRVV
ncbi:MAG: D-glycerate dehydrogenase, partial [Mesorhizobium sp.]